MHKIRHGDKTCVNKVIKILNSAFVKHPLLLFDLMDESFSMVLHCTSYSALVCTGVEGGPIGGPIAPDQNKMNQANESSFMLWHK